jgi:enoyl-[acyl-carrier protein] reductase II
MIRTVLCDLLDIDYPIIQGGMAWVATGELAAAVSIAGGLGVIGAGNAPPEIVETEINKVRTMTNKPFGVNIYYMSPFIEEIVDLVIEYKVPVVTTGAGNPGKHIPRLKEMGTKVFPVISSVALAKRLSKQDVDGFIAEGLECGGHVGDITSMSLVPQIVDATNLPVIAAGGIFDGRGLVASLALGACGVQMGTRFICAEECQVHGNYKKAILRAKDRDTVLTGMPGHQVRVLKNKLTRQFEDFNNKGASLEELEELGAGKLRLAAIEGDVDQGSLMAGQAASMVNEIQPAAEIIMDVMETASKVLKQLRKLGD